MTHEQPAPGSTPNYRPRHQREQSATVDGAQIIEWLVAEAPAADAAQRIRDAYRQHGTPYAAFLTLDGVNAYQAAIETDFTEAYLGSYRDRRALIESTIDTFGWQHDLDRLLAVDPLLRAVVTFDHDQIWGFASDHFDIVELDNRVHVFEAWDRPQGTSAAELTEETPT